MKPNQKIPEPPNIPEQEITPSMQELLDICAQQKEKIALLEETVQGLKDEIARLKKESPGPRSGLQIWKIIKTINRAAAIKTIRTRLKGQGLRKGVRLRTFRFTMNKTSSRNIFQWEADLRGIETSLSKT